MRTDDTDHEWEQRSVPVCPRCAALESEVQRLREESYISAAIPVVETALLDGLTAERDAALAQLAELAAAMGSMFNAADALLRVGLRAVVRDGEWDAALAEYNARWKDARGVLLCAEAEAGGGAG